MSPRHPRKRGHGKSSSDVVRAQHSPLTIDIEGIRRLIVDTGSNVSSSDIKVSPLKTFGVTGETLDFKGRQNVTFVLGGKEFKHTFLVCQLPMDAAVLIGADFLEVWGAILSLKSCELLIPHGRYDPRARDDALENHTALTVFTKGKEESSLQSLQPEAR